MQQSDLSGKISSQINDDFLSKYLESASEEDISSSATLRIFKNNNKFAKKTLHVLGSVDNRERMLDLGCGYGFTTKMIGTCLGFREIHGLDIDVDRISIAKERLEFVHNVDLETEKLPFPDEYFDLVISFGVFEHLKYYDNPIKEACRILKQKGKLFVGLPNLGCWTNRLLFLFGFHPRDVDISNSLAVGLPGIWPAESREAYGHIHACTMKAMTELLREYDFDTLTSFGVPCMEGILPRQLNTVVKAILRNTDKIASRRASLSLRFFILAQKGGC